MSNGDENTNKPIDLYNVQFEDPTITEQDDLQDLLQSLQPPGFTAPIINDYKPKIQLTESLLRQRRTNAIDTAPRITEAFPGFSVEPEYVENNLQSDSKNWWNTLYAQIDQIQLSKYKGRKLMHQTRIDELKQELDTNPELSPEDIEVYTREIKKLESEIQDIEIDIAEEEDELSRNPISDYYREATAAQQQEEASNWWSYLGSGEAAQDIGGSMSEAMSMAKAIVGPQLIKNVGMRLAAAWASTSVANVNPWVAAGTTIAGIGYGLYETWNMRDAESNAEAWDAYETRVKEDIALWESRNRSKAPKELVEVIKKRAAKGVREVYQQNMLLGFGDVAQVGAGIFMPWGRLTRNLLGTSRASKVLGYGVGMAYQGGIEGMEEGYQFLTKQDYLEGIYDKGSSGGTYGFGSTFDVGFLDRVSRGFSLGLETGQAMMGMLSGDYVGGRTNNPEFRNSVRAGAILGAGMGATIELGQNIFTKGYKEGLNTVYNKANKKHINDVIDSYGREEQVLYRAGSYYDMFSKGKTVEDITKIINKLPEDNFIELTKDEALADLNIMRGIYDKLQQPGYKNLSADEKKVVMATMMKSKDKAKIARNIAAETENTIQSIYEADSGIERKDGFKEMNRINNSLKAVDRAITDIKSILKDKNKAVNPKKVNERVLRDTLEQLENKRKELLGKVDEAIETYGGFSEATFSQDDKLVDLESKKIIAELEAERHNNYYLEMEKLDGENIKYFEPYAEELKSFVENKKEGQKKAAKAEEVKQKIKDPDGDINENDLVYYKGNEGTVLKRNSDGTLDVKIKSTGITEKIPEDQLDKLETFEGVKDKLSETRKKIEAGGLYADQDLNEEGAIIPDDILDETLSLAEVLEGEHKGRNEGSNRQGTVVGSHKNAQIKGTNPDNLENTGDEITAEQAQRDAKEDDIRLKKEPRPRFVFLRRVSGTSSYASMEPQTSYFLSQTPEKEIIENHDVIYRINSAGFSQRLIDNLGEGVVNLFKNPKPITPGIAKELNTNVEDLTKKLISLPIEMVLVNKKTGQIVKSRTEERAKEREVRGVLYDNAMIAETKNNLIKLKTQIYNILALNQTPIGSIEDIYGYQRIKYGEEQNDPRQVFGDTLGRVAIGDKNEQALRENKTSSEYIHPHFKWQDKFNGWVFLEINRPNSVTPVKANNRNINTQEAKVILNIYKSFLSKKASPKTPYANSGLTYGQMLNLLVYEGPGASTSKIDNKLYVDLTNKRIHYGSNKTSKGKLTPQEEEAVINHIKQHKKRRIDLQYTNRSIFSGELEALEKINFLGTEIEKGKNDDYNTILMDQGVITVNTDIQTNPFMDPNIFLSNEVNAKEKPQVIKKETETTLSKQDQALVNWLSTSEGSLDNQTAMESATKLGIKFSKARQKARDEGKTEEEADQYMKENLGKELVAGAAIGLKAVELAPRLEQLYKKFGKDIIKLKDTTKKLDFGNEDMGMFSEVTPETLGSPIIDEAEARAYWEKRTDFPLEFIDDFISIGNELGSYAQGMFQATGVKLSRQAATGVEYHELYHAIEETMLTNEEIQELNNETMKIVGLPSVADLYKYKTRWGNKISTKAVNELGFKTKDDYYRHLYLSEHRANNYQNYAASDGKTRFGKKETNFFKRLWNWIKGLFSKPKTTVDSLFKNIHEGYYKGKNPRPERMKALSEAGIISYSEVAERVFNEDQIGDISLSLLRHAVDNSGGIRTLLEKDEIIVDIENTFNNIKEQIAKDPSKQWLNKIVDHEEFFKNELRSHLLFINGKDTTVETEIENAIDENNTEILEAVRPAYEISNRDKARPAIKLLVLLTPELNSLKLKEGSYDVKISPYTNLVKPADGNNLFSILENELSDIVSDYIGDEFVTSEKQMLDKLKKLESTDPSFRYIYDAINKIPGLKTKFHAAFNLRSMNFLNANHRGKPGAVKFNLYDPGEFSRRSKVVNQWLENFQDLNLFETKEGEIVGNKENITPIVTEWKTLKNNRPNNPGLKARFIANNSILTDSLGKEISDILAKVGINTSTKELRDAYQSLNGKDNLQKFMRLVSGINKLFLGSGYSLQKMGEGKSIDFNDNNFFKDEKIIRTLANSTAKYLNHYGESVIRTANNKSHWLFAPYNYMTNIARIVKNGSLNNNKHVNDLLASPFNRTSRYLNSLKQSEDTRVELEVKTMGALRGGETIGQSFKNLKKIDEVAMRMALELNGYSLPMTYASKSVFQFFKGLPKIDLGAGFHWENDAIRFSDGIKGMFADKVLAEYNRMSQVAGHIAGGLAVKDMIVDYHYSIDKQGKKDFSKAKGLQFLNFPTLNIDQKLAPLFFKSDGTLVETLDKDTATKLYPYIEKVLEERVKEQYLESIKIGLIKRDNDILINKAIDLNIIKKYEKKYSETRTQAIKRAIAEYTINSMMNNLEMQHMFLGDPAFYKGTSIEKRPPSLLATGDLIGEIKDEYGNIKTHYTAAVINDIIKNSDIHPQLGRITSSDGNAYITAQHYKDIVTGLEGWSKDKEEAHQRLIRGTAKEKDIELIIAQPIKGMHYQLRNTKGMSIPTYLKYSQVPLYPHFTEGTKLDELRVAMEDSTNPIDVIVHMSAVKAGAQNPINILDEQGNIKDPNILSQELTPMRLEFRHWKLQQKSPVKKGDQLIGSQPKKQIVGALEVLNPDKPRHREIAKELNDIYAAQSNKQTEELKKKYGIDLINEGVNDNNYMYSNLNKLSDDIKDNMSRTTNISRHLRKHLDVVDNDFVNELSASPIRRKVQQIVASMYTKAAVKVKGPGGGKILINASLYEPVTKFSELSPIEQDMLKKSAFVNPEELKPTYIKNGKVIPGHVWLPHWMGKIIPSGKLSMNEVKQYLTDPRLRKLISYRIPTQFLSSIDQNEVVGFLPQSMGNSVIAYNEMVPKTGHDFDFDKLYTILPYFTYNKKTKEIEYIEFDKSKPAGEQSKKALHNRMIELYTEILSDVDVHKRSMKPIETLDDRYFAARIRAKENISRLSQGDKASLTKLRRNKEEYIDKVNDLLSIRKDLEWASPMYQLGLKRIFQVGAAGTGQFSLHTSDHGISSYNTLDEIFGVESMSIGHEDNSLGITDLRQMFDVEGNLIADTLSSQVNINVDIEGDPETAQGLNLSAATNNHRALLIRAGAPKEWVAYFMAQPIIKDLITTMDNNEGNLSEKQYDKEGLIPAQELVLTKYAKIGGYKYNKEDNELISTEGKTLNKLIDSREVTRVIPASKLYEMIGQGVSFPKEQLQILQYFKDISGRAKSLNNQMAAMSADVSGTGGSIAASLITLDRMNNAMNDENLYGIEGKMKGTAIEAYTENAPKLFINSTEKMFLESSNAFVGALNVFAVQSGRDLSDFSVETINLIIDHLYASMYMAIDNTSKAELKNMFYGENSTANKLWNYKHGKNKLQNVAIVDFLTPLKSREGGIGYIKGNTSAIKDSATSDRLVNSWSSRTEEFFTKELPKYALYASAWRTNLFSFHELTPQDSSLSIKINESFKNLKNPELKTERNLLSLNDSEYFMDIINQVYRHLHHNKILVPNARKNDIVKKSMKRHEKKKTGVAIEFKTESSKFKLDDTNYKPFITFENNLYKFTEVNSKGEGVYKITHKLGLRDANNRYIYEYSKSDGDRSFVPDNNLDNILKQSEEEGFSFIEEDDIETFEGGIYDSTENDELDTNIECP